MKVPEEIANIKWVKRWAGSYTFISCSYWGEQYYSSLERVLGVHFDRVLFIHRRGVVSFYLPQTEFKSLGENLARRVENNIALAKNWLQELKNNTDVILSVMKRLEGAIPSPEEYREFLIPFEKHLPYHNFMKKTVDFLTPEVLAKALPLFTDARLYSESVYSETEKFFRSVCRAIAVAENYDSESTTCLTRPEFENYIRKRVLPAEGDLRSRFDSSALFFTKGRLELVVGEGVDAIENLLIRGQGMESGELRGVSGFRGKVQGVVRLVLDPLRKHVFNEGDILVTGMTRPEFLPHVQKSGAIITDAGGVLCHAAIVARELKKPCVVGTEIATKVLKDGDTVSVDADKGIVTIIK